MLFIAALKGCRTTLLLGHAPLYPPEVGQHQAALTRSLLLLAAPLRGGRDRLRPASCHPQGLRRSRYSTMTCRPQPLQKGVPIGTRD